MKKQKGGDITGVIGATAIGAAILWGLSKLNKTQKNDKATATVRPRRSANGSARPRRPANGSENSLNRLARARNLSANGLANGSANGSARLSKNDSRAPKLKELEKELKLAETNLENKRKIFRKADSALINKDSVPSYLSGSPKKTMDLEIATLTKARLDASKEVLEAQKLLLSAQKAIDEFKAETQRIKSNALKQKVSNALKK